MKPLYITDIFLKLTIIFMSISPAFALGEANRNLLLIGFMGLSPIFILRYLELDRKDLMLLLLMALLIFNPLLNHPETMRWATVIYTILFCLTFMSYTRLLRHSNFTAEGYLKVLKGLLIAYTVVLLIQQFCVLTGLPIFNVNGYVPSNPWKLNSLTSEPSHSARIVGLLMYCYLYTKEIIAGRKFSLKESLVADKWIWICFLWTMLTMLSASSFVFIAIVFLKFLRLRNVLLLAAVAYAAFMALTFLEVKSFERTYKVFMATLTFDENIVMRTDGSAAARIVPTMKLMKTVEIFSPDGLFGHGIDQLAEDRVIDMSSVGYGKRGVTGGSMTLWYDYGFIVFILYAIFSWQCCFNKKDPIASALFWFFIVFLLGINIQMTWLTILLLYTNKKIDSKMDKIE